jgi:hypothetical protein
MGTTGAPWNIPFADPSDLVSAWPALSEDVAEAVVDGLETASLIRQIVSTTKTDTYSSSVGQGVETGDVTGLTATITPSDATHKVLVTVDMTVGIQSILFGVAATLYRNGTAVGIADDPGSSTNRTTSGTVIGTSTRVSHGLSFSFLDSPATTSAVVYSVRLRHDSNDSRTIFVNRPNDSNLGNRTSYATSTITAFEVAA